MVETQEQLYLKGAKDWYYLESSRVYVEHIAQGIRLETLEPEQMDILIKQAQRFVNRNYRGFMSILYESAIRPGNYSVSPEVLVNQYIGGILNPPKTTS